MTFVINQKKGASAGWSSFWIQNPETGRQMLRGSCNNVLRGLLLFPRNPNSPYWHRCCRCIICVDIVLVLTCGDDIRERDDDIRARRQRLSSLNWKQSRAQSTQSHGHMSLSYTLKLNISTTEQGNDLECVQMCIAQCRRSKWMCISLRIYLKQGCQFIKVQNVGLVSSDDIKCQ